MEQKRKMFQGEKGQTKKQMFCGVVRCKNRVTSRDVCRDVEGKG